MSLLSSLASFLLNNPDVSAFVSDRVYPARLPDISTASPTTMPALTYLLVSDPLTTTYDGKVIGKARVQINSYGASYKSAHGLADTIRDVLHGYRGAMGSITIGACFRDSVRDDPQPDFDMTNVSQDFILHYKE